MADKKTLTPTEEAFLEVLFNYECKGNVLKASEVIGVTPTTGYAMLYRLKDIVKEKAEGLLIAHTAESVYTLVDVQQNPNAIGAARAQAAAESILDRGAGLVKKQVIDVTVDTPNSLLILPDLDKDDAGLVS